MQQLVQDRPERVHVTGRRAGPREALRGQVLRGAVGRTQRPVVGPRAARQAEVGQPRRGAVGAGEEHVLGLHVAVDHPGRVGVGQAGGELPRQAPRRVGRPQRARRQRRPQAPAAAVLQDQAAAARAVLGQVQHAQHRRVPQPRQRVQLAVEAAAPAGPRVEPLDGHVGPRGAVARRPDGRGAAAAQHRAERVARPQVGRNLGRVGRGTPRGGTMAGQLGSHSGHTCRGGGWGASRGRAG